MEEEKRAILEPKDSGQVRTERGEISIAAEVVAIIAGTAAAEVAGLAGMGGGLVDGLAGVWKRKGLPRGVKVDLDERETTVDLSIIIEYGARIPAVAVAVQEKVQRAVEEMTGLTVKAVNINVQGVNIPPEVAA